MKDSYEESKCRLPGSMLKTLVAIVICTITVTFCVNGQDFSNGQWLDLTHEFNDKSIY